MALLGQIQVVCGLCKQSPSGHRCNGESLRSEDNCGQHLFNLRIISLRLVE